MPPSPTSNLLSSARNFIRKSAGTALAIAPLAAVILTTEAKAQTIFSVPGSILSATIPSGGSAQVISASFFSSQLGLKNNIQGTRQGVSVNFTTTGSSNKAVVNFGSSTISGSALPTATVIPVSYSFTLGATGALSITTWEIKFNIGDATTEIESGSGAGTFSGTRNLTAGTEPSNTSYTLSMEIQFTGASNGDVLSLTMNSSGPGISLNPVPEPSSYAMLAGSSMLAVTLVYRRRKSATS